MTLQTPIRIGTRASPLALYQARYVAELINKISTCEENIEIVPFTTRGDQLTSQRLINSGGKGLFTREIDDAVSRGDAELAVHSLKDVPSQLPDGQSLLAFPPREDPRDALLTLSGVSRLQDLPKSARLGTASLRREAQALALRPDLILSSFRGRVETRIDKLKKGEADATFLAMAGLKRLKLDHLAHPVPCRDMLPAAGQGIIAIAGCADRLSDELHTILQQIDDPKTRAMATAERAFLAELDGSCRTAMAAQLSDEKGHWVLRAEVLEPDGRRKWQAEGTALMSASLDELAQLGDRIAKHIRDEAGGDLPVFSD